VNGSAPAWVPFVQLASSVVAWFLVVIGWLVVSDQQDKREISKNAYSRLLSMRSELEIIEKEAVTHHTSAYSLDRVRLILRKVAMISGEVSHLRRLGFLEPSCVTAILRFRSAITLHNFDQSSYQALGLSDQRVTEIEVRRDEVAKELLEAEFRVVSRPRTLRKSVIEAVRYRIW
jgi:hypothetical protein